MRSCTTRHKIASLECFMMKTTNKRFQIASLLIFGCIMTACSSAQGTLSSQTTSIIFDTSTPSLVRVTVHPSMTPLPSTNTLTLPPTQTLTQPPLPTPTTTHPSPPTLTATQSPPVGISPVLHAGWISFTNVNYIQTMLIDRNGDLWAAGKGGVVHWDVKTGTYVKYAPEHGVANVNAIAQGKNGVLWLGTHGHGLLKYDGSQWTRHTTQDGLPGDVIYSVVVAHDEAIWLTTDNGIARYDGQSWIPYLTTTTQTPLSEIWELAVAPDGTLWGFGYHVVYFDGKSWIETIERPKGAGYLVGLAFAADSTVWIAGMDGIVQYDGQNWGSIYSPWKSVTKASVSAFAAAPDGSLWIGLSIDCGVLFDCTTPSSSGQEARKMIPGVYRFDGMKWKAFSTKDGLVDNEICSIVAGSDGSMWFGSCSQGVSRFDGQSWTTFQTKNEPPANFIGKLAASGPDNIWIGLWRQPWGVARNDGNEWVSYDGLNSNELTGAWVDSIFLSSDGTAWFGTRGALVRFDGHAWAKFSLVENDIPMVVYAITELTDHTYLIGSSTGAFIFDEQSWAITKEFDEFRDDSVECLLVHPDHSLWFGVSGHGISVYRNQTWKRYTLSDGLPSENITSFGIQPDGTVWAAAKEGVARFNGTHWKTYSNEFAEYDVTSLVVDGEGTIWVGTESRGLYKFDGQSWTNDTVGDGLDIIYDLVVDSQGAIWVATRGGLYRYIPSKP
jgi:ligand-binding sensor domain-containing protein